eukprot:TRINITY_DN2742_c0_g1_i1.p1 TRINITY_DN2742_c0_g1~~TRINITY_DN2742_c0_g1_i1.p1  ORF type:complete len:1018 (-),score=194.43 TRINITY_DN2742_c0_g1_i1:94-3147(-)
MASHKKKPRAAPGTPLVGAELQPLLDTIPTPPVHARPSYKSTEAADSPLTLATTTPTVRIPPRAPSGGLLQPPPVGLPAEGELSPSSAHSLYAHSLQPHKLSASPATPHALRERRYDKKSKHKTTSEFPDAQTGVLQSKSFSHTPQLLKHKTTDQLTRKKAPKKHSHQHTPAQNTPTTPLLAQSLGTLKHSGDNNKHHNKHAHPLADPTPSAEATSHVTFETDNNSTNTSNTNDTNTNSTNNKKHAHSHGKSKPHVHHVYKKSDKNKAAKKSKRPEFEWRDLICWRRRQMALEDRLLLSPWQKWKKYYRIPWKMILHVSLFCVVVTELLLGYVESSGYIRSTHSAFNQLFLERDDSEGNTEIYRATEFKSVVEQITNTFYKIQNISVGQYEFKPNSKRLTMKLTTFDKNFFTIKADGRWEIDNSLDTTTTSYELTMDNRLGPFSNNRSSEEVQDLLQRLANCQIHFHYISINPGELGMIPLLWHFIIDFTKTGGQLEAVLEMEQEPYTTADLSIEDLPAERIIIGFAVASFTLASLCLLSGIGNLLDNFALYRTTKRQYLSIPQQTMDEEEYPPWSDIPISLKLEFINPWVVWIIVTSVFVAVGSILAFVEEFGNRTHGTRPIFQGLGALAVTINLIRFLEYYKQFYTLILTIKIAFPRIVRYIISVAPLFMAYTFLGVTLFSPYSWYFRDMTATALTLFSLLNGDTIRDTFSQLNLNYPYRAVATIYLITFVAFFITTVLNVFIFIIEDSFHAAKISKRSKADFKAAKRIVDVSWKQVSSLGKDDHGDLGGDDEPGHEPYNYDQFDMFQLFFILDREFNDTTDLHPDEGDKSAAAQQGPPVIDPTDPAAAVAAIAAASGSAGDVIVSTAISGDTAAASTDSSTPSTRPALSAKETQETYKQLKAEMANLITQSMADFGSELNDAVSCLQEKYLAKLQKRTSSKLKQSFAHLNIIPDDERRAGGGSSVVSPRDKGKERAFNRSPTIVFGSARHRDGDAGAGTGLSRSFSDSSLVSIN